MYNLYYMWRKCVMWAALLEASFHNQLFAEMSVGAGGACGRDESLLGNVPSRIFQLPLDHRQYLRLALITGEKIEVIRDSGISVQRITRDQDRTIKHIDAFAKSFSVFSDYTIYGFLKFLLSLKSKPWKYALNISTVIVCISVKGNFYNNSPWLLIGHTRLERETSKFSQLRRY